MMMIFLTIAQAATEPPPAGWTAGADFVVKTTAGAPNIVFPLLAILGPVLVGWAVIYAAVKYGLPFVKDELAEFRKHTSDMLKQRSDDAAGDIAAARALSAAQHENIVSRVEAKLDRNTGELAKLAERSDRHIEILRDVARKVGVVVLLILLIACPANLSMQQTLAERVHHATQACVALPAGPPQLECSAKALRCARAAKLAAEAIQRAQTATAEGNTAVTAEAASAGLVVLATEACK